ncbi:ATP-dependent DNA helicase RecG [Agilicoccus flavus]|uniref:ATP-dependent DNA helicase RecG n=1 Tax=Agilicoccus flavus TaxID=2775968 RepID=UPI001CF63A30|nr:ATP-dependent DNA helicase RecG [Agilicoccus flavus]
MDLSTPLARALPEAAYKQLRKAEAFETVADLLWLLPRRYLDRHSDLGALEKDAYVVFIGTVVSASTRPMRNRRGTMLNATVRSGEHTLALTFFRAYGHDKKLVAGRVGLFSGTVSRYRDTWQLAHPHYEILRDGGGDDLLVGIRARSGPEGSDHFEVRDELDHLVGDRAVFPVYREVQGIPSWTLNDCIRLVLDQLEADGSVAEVVPPGVARERRLPGFLEAMRLLHLPATRDEPHRGLRRLRYEEAFVVQVVLALRRREQAQTAAVPRDPRPGGVLEAFDARLPFELTPGQHRVGDDIAADLALPRPMNRLLQGEVGSGKTVVALRAMLAVVDAGGQAALLAPTEVLAAQHHRSITAMLGDLAEGGLLGGADQGTRVALLTGGLPAAARKEALLQAASGEAGIVVGTHALIQDRVQFADLGLVVVDEQHRFGVEQRDALRVKAGQPPHVLVMTATPIPRTVAMTVFGDMETSVLDELPRGRSPITTHVVDNPRWYERAWERVAEEVRQGRQVYVVAPRIGESDARGAAAGEGFEQAAYDDAPPVGEEGEAARRPLRSVLDIHAELLDTPALTGARIEILHGRMPSEEKEAVMAAFGAGDIDVLCSTTVVEVGVDVPNASVMVVLDADRFGVSQLHQLRGRVGRGGAPGLCLLVAQDAPEPARERLAAVAATTDGFELSRFDLDQRKEGDVLGARQSGGASQLRVLRLARDEETILQARADAADLVESDPTLAGVPALAAAVRERIDERQAAFLEKG